MLSLVISSEKKDSSMHTKIQWNMSQNCEQAGEAFVLPGLPRSRRKRLVRATWCYKRKKPAYSAGFPIWSVIEDLNLRPLRPERSALPGCANHRTQQILLLRFWVVNPLLNPCLLFGEELITAPFSCFQARGTSC